MNNINHISIPRPCQQSWTNMAEITNGRFCGSCSKAVIDFSEMNNLQIIEYLANSSKVCGRFNQQQLDTLNRIIQTNNLKPLSFWKKMALAVTMLTATQYVKGQAIPVEPTTEQAPANFLLGKVFKADAIKYRTITECVTDTGDNLPLPGVTIKVTGQSIGALTDMDGAFRLTVPISATELSISYIGYNTKVVAIKPDGMENVCIDLKLSEAFMGEVVIKRPPMLKRIYYRFVKRPIKKIFG